MAERFRFFEDETEALWNDATIRSIIEEAVDMLVIAYDKGRRAVNAVHDRYLQRYAERAVEIIPLIPLAAIQTSYANLVCDEFDRR